MREKGVGVLQKQIQTDVGECGSAVFVCFRMKKKHLEGSGRLGGRKCVSNENMECLCENKSVCLLKCFMPREFEVFMRPLVCI